MRDLSLHILDVAENGVRAGAGLITITIQEDTKTDNLSLTIEDDGRGMPADLFAHALDPFVTTSTTRKVGLGLSLLQQSAQAADGDLELESSSGKGTKVRAVMRLSHIDRKPLGDMAETMTTLIQGNARIDFAYVHQKDGKKYRLDTRELREPLGECPLTHPDVLGLIRADILEGLREISAG